MSQSGHSGPAVGWQEAEEAGDRISQCPPGLASSQRFGRIEGCKRLTTLH
jgi:hypothetical protein